MDISYGYWLFEFRPKVPVAEPLPLPELKQVVVDNMAQLRQWPFPHVVSHGITEERYGISCSAECQGLCEHWKYSQDGRFEAEFAMIEDYMMENPERSLYVTSTLHRITEGLLFTAGVSKHAAYKGGLHIELTLTDCEGRRLVFWEHPVWNMMHMDECVCSSAEPLVWAKDVESSVLQMFYAQLAMEASLAIFGKFAMTDELLDYMQKEQDKLLSGGYRK